MGTGVKLSAPCIWVRMSPDYSLAFLPGLEIVGMWLPPQLGFKMALQELPFPQERVTHRVHGQVPSGGLVRRPRGDGFFSLMKLCTKTSSSKEDWAKSPFSYLQGPLLLGLHIWTLW